MSRLTVSIPRPGSVLIECDPGTAAQLAGGAVGGRSTGAGDRALTYIERIERRTTQAIARVPSQASPASTATDDGSKTGLAGYVQGTIDLFVPQLTELRSRMRNMLGDPRFRERDIATMDAFDAFHEVRLLADMLDGALREFEDAKNELRDA